MMAFEQYGELGYLTRAHLRHHRIIFLVQRRVHGYIEEYSQLSGRLRISQLLPWTDKHDLLGSAAILAGLRDGGICL